MTRLQNNGFSGTVSVTGTNTFTMTTAGAVTAIAGVDTYQLAAGAQTITLADAGQRYATHRWQRFATSIPARHSVTGTFTSAGNDDEAVVIHE